MRRIPTILLSLSLLCVCVLIKMDSAKLETEHEVAIVSIEEKVEIFSAEETDTLELPQGYYLIIDESNRELFGKPINRAVQDYSDAMTVAYRYLGSFYQDPPDAMYTAYDDFLEDEWFCEVLYATGRDCYLVQFAQLGGPNLVVDRETGAPLYFWEAYDETPYENAE